MKKIKQFEPLIGAGTTLENVTFGEYVEIGRDNVLENVVLGDYSYTGQWCFLQNTIVEKYANIAAMVRIGPTNHPYERASLHHFTYRPKMYDFKDEDDREFFKKREAKMTTIGHDTWIGHGAIIQAGVTIGHGAIVGSGAVVTKDVAPYTIVGGVPAQYIKYRFDPETAAKIQDIAWWDWSYDEIKARWDDFHLPIDVFIAKYGK